MPEEAEKDLNLVHKWLVLFCSISIFIANVLLIVMIARSRDFIYKPWKLTVISLAVGDIFLVLFPLIMSAKRYLQIDFHLVYSTTRAGFLYLNYFMHSVYGFGLISLAMELILGNKRHTSGKNTKKVYKAVVYSAVPWILGLTSVLPLTMADIVKYSSSLEKRLDVNFASVIFPACVTAAVCIMVNCTGAAPVRYTSQTITNQNNTPDSEVAIHRSSEDQRYYVNGIPSTRGNAACVGHVRRIPRTIAHQDPTKVDIRISSTKGQLYHITSIPSPWQKATAPTLPPGDINICGLYPKLEDNTIEPHIYTYTKSSEDQQCHITSIPSPWQKATAPPLPPGDINICGLYPKLEDNTIEPHVYTYTKSSEDQQCRHITSIPSPWQKATAPPLPPDPKSEGETVGNLYPKHENAPVSFMQSQNLPQRAQNPMRENTSQKNMLPSDTDTNPAQSRPREASALSEPVRKKKILMIISVVYFVCVVPYAAFKLLATNKSSNQAVVDNEDINITETVLMCLAVIRSQITPLIWSVYTTKLSHEKRNCR